MTELEDQQDVHDDDEIVRMLDDLFVEADDRATFGWALPDSVAPEPEETLDAAVDAARKRAVRAFGHQIRLTRRSSGYRTTGELAFAMRTLGLKITGATLGNWERGFILPDPRALAVAEQAMRTDGALLDSLHELIGNDEAAIEPEVVEADPDVHTRLRIEDLETRVADLEDEVETLRMAATVRGAEVRPSTLPATASSPVPSASTRSWLSRLRTAPGHHHSSESPFSGGGSHDRRTGR